MTLTSYTPYKQIINKTKSRRKLIKEKTFDNKVKNKNKDIYFKK